MLEGLGEVAERHPARFQSGFQFGTARPALYPRRPRHGVDLEDPVHPAHVEGYGCRVPVIDVGRHPAHDRRTTTERDQSRSLLTRPLEHCHHIGFVPRVGHHIGSVGEVPGEDPDRIGLGLPEAVQDPLVRFLRAYRSEARRRFHPGRWERELVETRYATVT